MIAFYKTFEFVNTINTIMWYALVVTAVIFCISSLDDCFFDVVYWFNRLKRWILRKKEKKIYYNELALLPEKRIAMLIPCWHEDTVIRSMLTSNLSQIDYRNYDVYVGIYPNDPGTRAEIEKVMGEFKNLHYVINSKEGPTTKADNLNAIYKHILNTEVEQNIKYDIFVLHDAEDIIHPLSFRLYNYATNEFDMIQTPVFPLEVPLFNFTHWVYNDEFAEMHLNTLIVRKYIKGLVPSAGVGTAFTRDAMNTLIEHSKENIPFSTSSIIEDYDAALRLQDYGMKTTFFPFTVTRIVKKKKLFGGEVTKEKQQIIATRALFPTTYLAAIKQRTRWVYGIALQEWASVGWPGSAAVRFTLLHDRKSILTHFFNGFAYAVLIYWLISYFTNGFYYYHLETLPQFLDQNPWMVVLILISTIFMVERILNRIVFTGSLYGFFPAILSIPRILYANVMNIHTSYIAMVEFLLISSKRRKVKWEKTGHVFPSESQLAMYKRKLGDIMLDEGLISTTRLKKVIDDQAISHEKLGKLLLQSGYIDLKRLTEILAQQNNLQIIDAKAYSVLGNDELPELSSKNYEWLIENKLLPVKLSDNLLTIAIADPTQLSNRSEIQKMVEPYHAKFVLISLAHKLGDILLAKGLVNPQQIIAATSEQVRTHEKLGSILVHNGYITQKDLTAVLAEQYNLEIIDSKKVTLLTAEQLPRINSSTYQWLVDNRLKPVSCDNTVVIIILPDPADEQLRKMAIKNLSPYEVKFVLSSE